MESPKNTQDGQQFSHGRAGLAYISSGDPGNDNVCICIHGWGCQASDYTLLLEQFASTKSGPCFIAVDSPGHGRSPKDKTAPPSVDGFARAILDLMEEEGVVRSKSPSFTIIGHSMGCRVVLSAFEQALDKGKPRIKSLIFLDGSSYNLRTSLFAFDNADKRSSGMTEDEKERLKAEAFRRMFSVRTPVAFQDATLAHVKAVDADRDFRDTIRASLLKYDAERMNGAMEGLGKSGLPVLVLQSTDIDNDNQRIEIRDGEPTKWMKWVAGMVPHSKQIIVDQSGHFLHVDQTELVAEHIRAFLDQSTV